MPNLKKLNLFLIEPKLKATNCLRTLLYNIIIWQIEYVISRGILVLKMDCGCRQKHECVCVCVCVCVCARARPYARMSVRSVVSNFTTPWTTTHHDSLWNFPGKNTGVGCHFLLQGIFPTQEWNCVLCVAGRFFITKPSEEPKP